MSSALSCVWLAAALMLPLVTQHTITIHVRGTASPDVRRGLEFGLAEVSQTAKLLGAEVRISDEGEHSGPDAIVVVSPERGAGVDVPSIHLHPLPETAGRCDFSVAAPRDAGTAGGVVRWHPGLTRYGASEVNERFARMFGAPLTDDGWAAWVSIKALVESALRNPGGADPCAALQRLKFDGHKGRPLFFDPVTRVLSQPLYTAEDGRVIGAAR